MAAALSLNACGDPPWRDPAGASAQTEPPFRAPGSPPQVRRVSLVAKMLHKPSPDPPVWAAPLIGQTLHSAFPGLGSCEGNTDNVLVRYIGPPSGVKIVGWGWDTNARRGFRRIVAADDAGLIVGAGEGELPRPDVMRARPNIDALNTGWQVTVRRDSGSVEAYGVMNDGRSVCRLGRLDIQ